MVGSGNTGLPVQGPGFHPLLEQADPFLQVDLVERSVKGSFSGKIPGSLRFNTVFFQGNGHSGVIGVYCRDTGIPAADSGFGQMLQNVIGDMANKGHQMDAKALAAANGKGDLVDVVTAVAETEVAVETLVSVRDRMIQAYEEIMRMPI